MADPLPPTTNLPARDGRLDVLNISQPDREIPPMRCCCGDLQCDVLRHNSTVLDSVEKDVHLAASVGQVRCFCFSCATLPSSCPLPLSSRQAGRRYCSSSRPLCATTLMASHVMIANTLNPMTRTYSATALLLEPPYRSRGNAP